ncbi:zinc-binding dehydrogenase [Petroclostridium xylanilyticum]|uniref:zinc-binding dehydrogenase n=1 Tax=Petroclostridium xylanilyticum TaxID=1792311 RepID=UPI0018E3C57F|nr:zinc-binding dehydrogenase [Petroclostridium xylanilyticum]
MKAVVKYDNVDGATELREVPIPEIGPDDVLVKVAYIGICGSDPHMHHNKVTYKVNVPLILGHEFSGTIEKIGENVKGYQIGDRVTAETHADYCGKCILCRTNNYHVCRERKGYGFQTDGAFAKYVRVPSRILHKVPENVSLKEACLTEPLCVAYSSLVKHSNMKPGDLVVIIGPGPIGLLCTKVASLIGASDIIVIGTDGDEGRLEKAKELGATLTISSSKENPVPIIMGMRDGYGADIVVDTAGFSPTLKLSMDVVRPCGQINKIGWGPKPVDFSLDPLISKAVTVNFTFSHNWDIWEQCLVLMNKKAVDLNQLITHELPLDKWQEGFELIESKKGLKVVLTPID